LGDIQESELILVVSVSSFTDEGFAGTASYRGRSVEFGFDEGDEGVFLTPEMAKALGVRKGSKVLVVVEAEDEPVSAEASVAGLNQRPRISSARVYYELGKEGGGVVRVRKA
jgi:ABC-type lipoprotein release transport system permease subunit